MKKTVLYILLFAAFAMAEGVGVCTVDSIAWVGEHTDFDELQMNGALGQPCDAWKPLADKLVRYYEDEGFIAARVQGDVAEAGGKDAGGNGAGGKHVLTLKLDRGSAWVWAPAENLDSSGTKTEVFRRLAGIVEGAPVSLTDLERSERRLARIGYFDKTAPARLYRDPSRNRIFPAYSMRKANVSTAEGVLTYSSEENVWEGKLDVSLFNIAGTARDLQLEGFTGEDSRHLSGYYKEPWILGTAWNVVVRGNFDEETVDAAGDIADVADTSGAAQETVERVIVGEVGITRDIGFDFSIGVYFGISEDDKHSSFEMSYVSLDSITSCRRRRAWWRITRCMATSSVVFREWPAEYSRVGRRSGAPTCLRLAARATSRECIIAPCAVAPTGFRNLPSCGKTAMT